MRRAISYRQSSLGIYSDINFIDSYFLGIYYALGVGFPVGAVVKNPFANAGDVGSIPELGRSPGEGNGNPLLYSCWEIPWTEEPGGLQSTGSDTIKHTQRQQSYKGPTGSCNWKWRGGSCPRLNTVLKTISFCQSALLPTG